MRRAMRTVPLFFILLLCFEVIAPAEAPESPEDKVTSIETSEEDAERIADEERQAKLQAVREEAARLEAERILKMQERQREFKLFTIIVIILISIIFVCGIVIFYQYRKKYGAKR